MTIKSLNDIQPYSIEQQIEMLSSARGLKWGFFAENPVTDESLREQLGKSIQDFRDLTNLQKIYISDEKINRYHGVTAISCTLRV